MCSWVNKESTIDDPSEYMGDRTGSHTPRQVIPLPRSFRTNAPVGAHTRPDPTHPDSCRENNGVSGLFRWLLSGKDVQVMSSQRDGETSSFGNRYFGVHFSRGANNWFRER